MRLKVGIRLKHSESRGKDYVFDETITLRQDVNMLK